MLQFPCLCFPKVSSNDPFIKIQIFSKGSWEITTPALGVLCRSLGTNPLDEEVTDMINEMDDDVSGCVQFPEFARFFFAKMKSNDVDNMKYFGGTGEDEFKMVMGK